MCLTLGPRLLALPGPNSLIASQSFQSKSSSPFPGSKAPTYSLFTLWLLSCPLPSLSLLQTHWPPGCYLDLLSNFQPQGLCTPCSPLFEKHCLWMYLLPPASGVLLKYYFTQNRDPSNSCHISHVLCFTLCCLSFPVGMHVTWAQGLLFFPHCPST